AGAGRQRDAPPGNWARRRRRSARDVLPDRRTASSPQRRFRARGGHHGRQLLRPCARRGLRLRGADLVPRRHRWSPDTPVHSLSVEAAASRCPSARRGSRQRPPARVARRPERRRTNRAGPHARACAALMVEVHEGRVAMRPRVARIRATHSYRSVLALIFVSFLFASIANDATWTESVLLVLGCTTLAAAMWTSGFVRARSNFIWGLAIAATVIAVVLPITDRNTLNGVASVLSGVIVVATIFVIAVGVL